VFYVMRMIKILLLWFYACVPRIFVLYVMGLEVCCFLCCLKSLSSFGWIWWGFCVVWLFMVPSQILGGPIGFKTCLWEWLVVIDWLVMSELWYWHCFLVFACWTGKTYVILA